MKLIVWVVSVVLETKEASLACTTCGAEDPDFVPFFKDPKDFEKAKKVRAKIQDWSGEEDDEAEIIRSDPLLSDKEKRLAHYEIRQRLAEYERRKEAKRWEREIRNEKIRREKLEVIEEDTEDDESHCVSAEDTEDNEED